jgi:hypothetical protein
MFAVTRRRPRVFAHDVILDVGASLKVIWKSQLRLIGEV